MTSELPASQLSASIVDEIEQLKGTFPDQYNRRSTAGPTLAASATTPSSCRPASSPT
ncbi:hypothetical protein OG943_11815 [Amycolatopsis sp. NBC_00345]|uniref:hypothetical protein n=1 Tax=Amycolatopsis sp. NBC_00345 TaxID=2975955 RepID=UPI002E263B0A